MEFNLSSINPLHKSFKTIGIVGRPRNDMTLQMHKNIFLWLQEKGYQVLIEEKMGKALEIDDQYIASIEKIGEQSQLVIVIGGDGNMLGHARVLAKYNTLLIGINRGNLGFLTDIDPKDTYNQLESCLNGEFFIEERFILEAKIERDGKLIANGNAINEIVVHPTKIAKMIDFHVYINDKFAFSQSSDGLIVATPTGSTAYSLSAGGPILTPQLNVLSLVSICPHTLSSRPIVIDGDSKISMRFADYTLPELSLSCDGQIQLEFTSDDIITIQKSTDKFRLIHLNNYNYYNVLRTKLGWLKKLF